MSDDLNEDMGVGLIDDGRPNKLVDGELVPLTDEEMAEYQAEPLPPSTDPADYPLLPWQFKALVIFLGVDAQIKTAINTLPSGMERAAALSRYQNASAYRYDDPLLQQIRAAIGMSEASLTDAWLQAKELRSS